MTRQKQFSYGGFLQFATSPAAPDLNLEKVRDGLCIVNPPPNSIIILPELWATGFEYEKIAELSRQTGWLLEKLQEAAEEYDIVIGGSLPEKVELKGKESIYNTLFFTGKKGVIGRYRKQHLFSLWGEDDWFTQGDEPWIIESENGAIGALVCFDLRFPEIARAQCQQGANLLAVSAQWPLARYKHWRLLLQARAIENQIYIVACNAIGDYNTIELAGHSMVIDPNGEVLLEASQKVDCGFVELNYSQLNEVRSCFTSVAPRPYSFPDKTKIITAQTCDRILKRRRALGQSVVIEHLNKVFLDLKEIKYLQNKRQSADFFVVASEQRGDVIEQLASLACVDAVVVNDECSDYQPKG